ncbi:MAG: glycoside hydrolase family 92 protein, partial [Clostridia bacterium]|nr:glycoside hydrolase family 92 protein [Clostridia bacterium]
MENRDFTRYVNVFQGNGDYDLPPAEGIAARWFFIKAGAGNTSPAATRPYGRVSVGPYTGGYPNGSSSAFPNYLAKPRHFDEGRALIGFSHLHQSGTGSIGCYYNFAVVTPRYADSPARVIPADVEAEPGYYACTLGDIRCEVTVTEKAALHRYTFARDGGELRVDLARYGLRYPGLTPQTAQDLKWEYAACDTVSASGVYDGLRLYFTVCCSEPFGEEKDGVVTAALPEGVRTVELAVAVSPKDAVKAMTSLRDDVDFDAAREQSREQWNAALGAISLADGTPADKREIFYSNLYHSLVKPCDRSGEDFVTGAPGPFSVDYATLWDQYKTQLPLVFLLDRAMSEIIVETL